MSFLEVTLTLIEGFGTTVTIFCVTLLASLPLGLGVSFLSMSKIKIVRGLTKTFIWIIRGTPLMLQIIAIFFIPGLLFGMPMKNRFLAASIAFIINYSCYFSEIYRSGIEGVNRGQYEAGQVLGMKNSQIFISVVLPQVIKRVLPPLGNEIITLVKDTSLVRIIALAEIIMKAYEIIAEHGLIYVLFYTGAFYLIFVGGLTLLFNFLEKKLSYYN